MVQYLHVTIQKPVDQWSSRMVTQDVVTKAPDLLSGNSKDWDIIWLKGKTKLAIKEAIYKYCISKKTQFVINSLLHTIDNDNTIIAIYLEML